MERINSLLFTQKTSKANSERAELVKYFVDNLRQKNGKPFSARMIAIKLSHLSVQDLYYMKSVFNDLAKTKGNESAQKWWWWSLKLPCGKLGLTQ
jgi:hypothetical protein